MEAKWTQVKYIIITRPLTCYMAVLRKYYVIHCKINEVRYSREPSNNSCDKIALVF